MSCPECADTDRIERPAECDDCGAFFPTLNFRSGGLQ